MDSSTCFCEEAEGLTIEHRSAKWRRTKDLTCPISSIPPFAARRRETHEEGAWWPTQGGGIITNLVAEFVLNINPCWRACEGVSHVTHCVNNGVFGSSHTRSARGATRRHSLLQSLAHCSKSLHIAPQFRDASMMIPLYYSATFR